MMQPILRFQQFKGEWETKKLNDLGSFRRSYSFSRSYEGEGNYKHLHYGDIHSNFSGILDDETPIPSITVSQDFEVIMNKDLIFADASEDYNDLGKSAAFWNFTLNNVVAGLHTHLFRPLESVDSRFLMYFTQTSKYFTFIRRVGTGISVLGLSKTNLGLLDIDIPKYEEQQKIADFFTLFDQCIKKQQEKVEALREYKKGMMQKLFSRELRFKDENGQEFPEWEKKRLGDIADVRDGTHDSPKFFPYGKPLITSKNLLKSGKLDLDNVSFINDDTFEQVNQRSKVDIGDILFGMIGTIGNPVRVKSNDFAIKNVALIKEKNASNEFILFYLKTAHIAKQFYITRAGGTQKFIALGVIRELQINLPSIWEQEKISNVLSHLSKKIEKEEEKLNYLKEEKKGFMQKMFV